MATKKEYDRARQALMDLASVFAKNLPIVLQHDPDFLVKFFKFAGLDGALEAPAQEPATDHSLDGSATVNVTEVVRKRPNGEIKIWSGDVPSLLFEYAVLTWLEHYEDDRNEKRVMYEFFKTIGLGLATYAAFCTRLHKMKVAELVSWEDRKRNPGLAIADKGKGLRPRLAAGGPHGMKARDLAWFRDNAPWGD